MSTGSSTGEVKYLGHYMAADLSDERDINRQLCMQYAQANMLILILTMCSVSVNTKLCKAYCTTKYTSHRLRYYWKSSMHKLLVAYNDGLWMLLRVPQWSSASQMFWNAKVPTCAAVLVKLMYSCMCRLTDSESNFIYTLTNPGLSSVMFFAIFTNHWCITLHVNGSTFYLKCLLF